MSEYNVPVILGGAGFIGSHLAARFRMKSKNFLVCDIDDGSKETITLDVENLDSLDQIAGAECIINLAAVHRDDIRPISRYDDVNVRGALNVCEVARKHGSQPCREQLPTVGQGLVLGSA